jgi:hypothetical protein
MPRSFDSGRRRNIDPAQLEQARMQLRSARLRLVLVVQDYNPAPIGQRFEHLYRLHLITSIICFASSHPPICPVVHHGSGA